MSVERTLDLPPTHEFCDLLRKLPEFLQQTSHFPHLLNDYIIYIHADIKHKVILEYCIQLKELMVAWSKPYLKIHKVLINLLLSYSPKNVAINAL